MGKVALIDRLTDDTACQGDDCAVLGKGKTRTLVTEQTLVDSMPASSSAATATT